MQRYVRIIFCAALKIVRLRRRGNRSAATARYRSGTVAVVGVGRVITAVS